MILYTSGKLGEAGAVPTSTLPDIDQVRIRYRVFVSELDDCVMFIGTRIGGASV